MAATLMILRHAPTEWNGQGRLQGRIDQPLSAAGAALAATWRLPPEGAGRQWHLSPLTRAQQTARLIGVEGRLEPRLAEMSWGDWEGAPLGDLRASGVMTRALEALGLDLLPPSGESPRQVGARLGPWLAEIAAQGGDHGAVAHNGVIRALYALATGWDMTAPAPDKLRDQRAHLFEIADDGTPSVTKLNIPLTE